MFCLSQSRTTSWGLSQAGESRCCPAVLQDDFSLISFLHRPHSGVLSESGLEFPSLRHFLFVKTVQASKCQAMPLCAHLMSKLNAKEEKFGDNWTQEGCLFWGRWWAVDNLVRSAYDDLHVVQQLHSFLLKHLSLRRTLPVLCRCWTRRATVRMWTHTHTPSSAVPRGKGREGAQILAATLCRGFIFHSQPACSLKLQPQACGSLGWVDGQVPALCTSFSSPDWVLDAEGSVVRL